VVQKKSIVEQNYYRSKGLYLNDS